MESGLPHSSLSELGNIGDGSSCSSADRSCEGGVSCCGDLVCGSQSVCVTPAGASETMDWTTQLANSRNVMNQGSCGSCWAVASTAVLQLQAAKAYSTASTKVFDKLLSPQNVLACAPNPMECGGDGGCGGSTPSLAFGYLKSLGPHGGLTTLENLPYLAK